MTRRAVFDPSPTAPARRLTSTDDSHRGRMSNKVKFVAVNTAIKVGVIAGTVALVVAAGQLHDLTGRKWG